MTTSSELILRASAGDEPALEALIGAHQVPMARFVIQLTGPGEHHLDLCQTIFVKMMRGLPSLKSAEVFEPWLYRIARNVCTDHLRTRRRQKKIFVSLGESHDGIPSAPSEAASSRSDPAEAIRLGVRGLAQGQRELLELSIERPRTYEELAGLTNLSIAAVRNRLFRARERLKQLVGGRKEDDER